MKTTSVTRQLSTISAVFASIIQEQELERTNPFKGLRIGGLGADSKKRTPLSNEQLRTVSLACITKDDEIRWLLALQIDLGSRIGEVVGLSLNDLITDGETPHVVFMPHPWRSLKTAASQRKVPLTGLSLWAAQRIKQNAAQGQAMAFPRYCTVDECKSTHASNTLNDWIRSLKIDKTTHELRHSMADRLREVGCPEDVRKAIGGWAGDGMASRYGEGYSLRIKREWLEKVVLPNLFTTPAPAPNENSTELT